MVNKAERQKSDRTRTSNAAEIEAALEHLHNLGLAEKERDEWVLTTAGVVLKALLYEVDEVPDTPEPSEGDPSYQ